MADEGKELWTREKTRRQADSKRNNLGKREFLPAVLPDDQYAVRENASFGRSENNGLRHEP